MLEGQRRHVLIHVSGSKTLDLEPTPVRTTVLCRCITSASAAHKKEERMILSHGLLSVSFSCCEIMTVYALDDTPLRSSRHNRDM
jgi:hypothetical protein